MPRARKQLFIAFAVIAAIVVTLILAGPSMQRSFFYPKPRGLPAVVRQTTDELLARLQSVLETNAPIVARALQPGLSDAQITTLEAQGGFRLSDDLRAFYRWHNGIATNSTIGLLAGQRFVPLDEFVRERAEAEGAFFHHFAEMSYYLWFPSFRNFLAGVIECYESRAIKAAADGKSLDEDFDRTQKIWERFAKSSEGGG